MNKIIKFKHQQSEEKQTKKHKNTKISKRRLAIIIAIIVILLILIITSIIYASNKSFRNFMDKYVFMKNITNENVPIIEVDYNSNTNVIPYGRYICILAENNLVQYNSSGKKEELCFTKYSD